MLKFADDFVLLADEKNEFKEVLVVWTKYNIGTAVWRLIRRKQRWWWCAVEVDKNNHCTVECQ